MHFTRLGAYRRRARCRSSPAARAATCGTSTASAISTGCPDCSRFRSATAAPSSARPQRRRPRRSGYFPVWSFAHEPAIELADAPRRARARRPQPRVPHAVGWRGDRHRDQVGAAVLQAASAQPLAHEGDLALPRLPRHVDRRAQRDRRAVDQDAVRTVDARRRQGADAVPLPLSSTANISTPARCAAPTTSRCASRWKVPSRSPRCSWSRCRTPAARSLRRRATGRASARSATSTACCWSATR